jgi:hypothetical protein
MRDEYEAFSVLSLSSSPQAVSGQTSFLGHPRKWLAGIHPEEFKDGCPMTNVGHDNSGKSSM